MKLSILERIVVFGVLPERANFNTWQTVKALKDALAINESERATIEWKEQEGGGVTWNPQKAVALDIVIPIDGLKLILDGFRKLDSESQLTMQQADVMARFKELKAEV